MIPIRIPEGTCLWAVMEFGQQGITDKLDSSKIHRLANILTLDHCRHTQFDRLALWLEADDIRDVDAKITKICSPVYRICSTDNNIIRG